MYNVQLLLDSNPYWNCGIHENNEAHEAVKSALEFEIVKFKIPTKDLKIVYHYIKSLWQIFLNFCDTKI